MSHVNGSRAYSRAEYLSDAAIHVLGIGFALIAGPALVAIAAIRIGDATTVTALTVYALTLLAMLTCSALYNMIRLPHWSDRLRRLDQSAIYFKIAGTYTPFVVLFPGSPMKVSRARQARDRLQREGPREGGRVSASILPTSRCR
jgi:hemolysin III